MIHEVKEACRHIIDTGPFEPDIQHHVLRPWNSVRFQSEPVAVQDTLPTQSSVPVFVFSAYLPNKREAENVQE